MECDEQWVERADAVGRRLSRRAAEADRDRRLPVETLTELGQSGLLDLIDVSADARAPSALLTHARCAMRLAEDCGSTGWLTALHGAHTEVLRALPADVRRGVRREDEAPLTTAIFSPEGRLEPTAEGYRLDGRWGFGSGCMHASHALLAATVQADGDTESTGRLGSRLAWVPMESIRIQDTWRTSGLRGTGSHDLIASGVNVPAAHTLDLDVAFTGCGEYDDGGRQRLPLMPLLTLMAAAPAVGIARGFTRNFAERARSKRLLSGEMQLARPLLQMRFAESTLEIETAERRLFDSLERLLAREAGDSEVDPRERARHAFEGAWVTMTCHRAVDRLMGAAGASAHFESSALRRAHADLSMLRGHIVFDFDRLGAAFGRSLWGANPEDDLV